MYRGLLSAVAGAALIFGSVPALADNHDPAINTGNDLLQSCRATGWDSGYCYGYILGVYRGIAAIDEVRKSQTFCGMEGGTVEQAELIVQQYMLSHPKIMNSPSQWVVISALMDAFPCAKS